jgi:hypothetical protein
MDSAKGQSAVMKPVLVGALAVGAFIAAIVYLKHDSAPKESPTTTVQSAPSHEAARAEPAASAAPAASGPGKTDPKEVPPPDPRLAALAVSPDNGLIEFVRAPDGKVISEIDKDPSSPSFKKPLREYMYSGDRVIGLTAYHYLPDHIEISRTAVSYKPDGSVDRFAESTSFESAKKK